MAEIKKEKIQINKLSKDAHWNWLKNSFTTFRLSFMPSIGIGFAIVFCVWAIISFLHLINFGTLIPAVAGGFVFTGPIIATAIYNLARHVENGQEITSFVPIKMQPYSKSQLGYIGFVLFFVIISWAIIAHVIWSINVGMGKNIDESDFVKFLFSTPQGINVLIFGLISGALLGGFCFAISVISLPLVFDRDIDAISAVALSVKACFLNPVPMVGFAIIIAILFAISSLFLFVPLIFVFPFLGHVTWCAYRENVN